MMKAILWLHRYLAVAVGILMTLWCVSGFVMMYQGFPAITRAEQLRGLAPLDFSQCCQINAIDPEAEGQAFRIEMLLGRPVMRLRERTLDLITGRDIPALDDTAIEQVARDWAAGNQVDAAGLERDMIDMDQWTIQTARRNSPVNHIRFNDDAGTEIYVNGSTGEVFQKTSTMVRFWSWLGAVPHWIYPTLLRQNGALWVEVVIWTSVAGTFLTLTGLYVGLKRYRWRRKSQRSPDNVTAAAGHGIRNYKKRSPYTGLWYWHHILGLVFGVLTLTWVFSGLLTMNPWGWLTSPRDTIAQDMQGTFTWGEAQSFLRALANDQRNGSFSADIRQLSSSSFANELSVLAYDAKGDQIRRLDSDAREAAPVSVAMVVQRLNTLGLSNASVAMMMEEDLYYYEHKSPIDLPVIKASIDEGARMLYVQPDSGQMQVMNGTQRLSRWTRVGMHRLDYPGLKSRPVWDMLVIVMLFGVTCLVATGTWMSFRRIRQDTKLAFKKRKTRQAS